MKERPTLFSTEMVRAILDGRKTQTRRVIKPQPEGNVVSDILQPHIFYLGGDPDKEIQCPYGQGGDRLWIREAWVSYGDNFLYRADGEEYYDTCSTPSGGYPENCRHHPSCIGCTVEAVPIKWRPSIHMPHWASRINLEITGIRVERIQDITENDAQSEGVPSYEPDDFPVAGATYGIYKDRFTTLWNNINEKRGYGWDVNPWCWCIEFKKVTL
jgi:hypothetical protein